MDYYNRLDQAPPQLREAGERFQREQRERAQAARAAQAPPVTRSTVPPESVQVRDLRAELASIEAEAAALPRGVSAESFLDGRTEHSIYREREKLLRRYDLVKHELHQELQRAAPVPQAPSPGARERARNEMEDLVRAMETEPDEGVRKQAYYRYSELKRIAGPEPVAAGYATPAAVVAPTEIQQAEAELWALERGLPPDASDRERMQAVLRHGHLKALLGR